MDHTRREQQIERNWRIFRLTSMIAAGVVLVLLLAIDASFRFESWRLNVTLILLAVILVILLRLDPLLHRLVQRMRRRRFEKFER